MIMPNGAAGTIGVELGARGGAFSPAAACATGNESIARGFELVASGAADVAVVGGTDAVVHPLPLASFAAMKALSPRNDDPTHASRPFDADRDGFVLGEGAGILVLESAEHAAARGARVYARVLGVGLSSDGHHIVQPQPAGIGATLAMRRALESAGVTPADVVHVNAHSTATPVGDVAEAKAIHASLGSEHARRVVVTAPKSTMGHLVGAAGAVESIQTVLSLYTGKIPPTANLDKLDPDIDLDVAVTVRELPAAPSGNPAVALNNSFGFGGSNAAVVFGKA
jgi:3-oxoacyl-[acyl-carrier-protein] synthase II